MPYIKHARGAILSIGFALLTIHGNSVLANPDAELNECALIADDAERLNCYDTLSGRPQAIEPAAVPEEDSGAQTSEEVAATEGSAMEKRIEETEKISGNWFGIKAYRPNYLLPGTHNSRPNAEAFNILRPNDDIDELEAKFQLSVQFNVWDDILGRDVDLYFAYTQLAFWQVYNTEASSPFRETNYEPEIGFIFHPNLELFGFKNQQIRFGASHQSNGRGGPLSRSWNRLFWTFTIDKGNYASIIRTWYRIPEDDENDDNPDIDDFLGNFEWHNVYKWRDHTFSVMLRNNLRTDDNRGAVEVGWSYPLNDRLKLYMQYFNGYGESLIDYDHSISRIGLGLMLTDWL